MKIKLLAAIMIYGASCSALAQYVIGGVRYTCPVGANWNDPRCMREELADAPTYDQQPEPLWEERWGSIATDSTNGILGTSIGMRSKSKAENFALLDCRNKGGASCEIDLSYSNQCAALVMGTKTYHVQGAETAEIATRIGMETCHKSNESCFVYYKDCSLPARVR